MTRRYSIASLAFVGLVATSATAASGFEAGQRWACVTDQGSNAFLSVIAVNNDAVTFSWGAIDPENNSIFSLCQQQDELSVEEMKSFCRLLGDDRSEGHVRLSKACLNK